MAQQLFVKFFNKKLREDPFNCYRAVTSLRTMWLKYVIYRDGKASNEESTSSDRSKFPN